MKFTITLDITPVEDNDTGWGEPARCRICSDLIPDKEEVLYLDVAGRHQWRHERCHKSVMAVS